MFIIEIKDMENIVNRLWLHFCGCKSLMLS